MAALQGEWTMTAYGWLAAYSAAILLISLFGGSLPFLGRVSHSRLQFYLSASAGVMLGASFFHVMPDAMELSGKYFGWWMSLGVVGLLCIERFIAPHSHEVDGNGKHHHEHGHHHEHAGHEHEHHHEHEHMVGLPPAGEKDHRAAAPAVAGWMAVFGLTIHTFMNGVGLAGAVQAVHETPGTETAGSAAAAALPGLAMFLAIFLHKPADALAISTVLSRKGVPRRLITLVQLGFALMVPIGAAAFCLTAGNIEDRLRGELTGAALAFSAGTFLFIALSDLLPEVQFHRHDRVPLFLALAAGVALMGGIALLEEQGHGHEHGAAATSADHEQKGHVHGAHDEDHDEGHHDHHH
jgi:zinc and cadmium transporter